MERTGQPGSGQDLRSVHLDVTVEQPSDVLVVLRVTGEIDADNSRVLDHWLQRRIPPKCRYIVVDLTGVSLIAASGVRVLVEHTDRHALAGRRMLTVAGSPPVQRILRLLGATRVLGQYDSVPAAVAACLASNGPVATPSFADELPRITDGVGDELAKLRHEVFGLRAALRTRPVIARALGVLEERYGLADVDAAFELLREHAQHHNLRAQALARALLAAPAPQGEIWFPGRAQLPAPSLSFFQQNREHKRNRTAVLGSFLDTVLDYVHTTMGDVQLIEGPGHLPRPEAHRGLPPELADHIADLGDSDWPPVKAVHDETRVVEDVPVDPDHAIFAKAGVSTIHSTPLITFDGQCVGVVSTYHSEPGFTPATLACARIDHIATETADWVSWHQRTVVLDALEQLHRRASGHVKRG